MDFQQYQTESRKVVQYPDAGHNFIYPTLGLAGEAGEVADKIKKVIRNDGGLVSESVRQDLAKELGDVLWYVSQVATELNLQLDDIARGNLEKLQDRLARNVIRSTGDNR